MSNSYPSSLETHLGYWLRCLSNFVSGSFASRLEKYDVSVAQWVVLRSLYDKENITLNEAADLIGLDKSSVSRMIDRLVLKKLIKRITNVNDYRSIHLSLSTRAKNLVPVLAKEADDNDHFFFKSLTSKEKKELEGLVKNLLKDNNWTLKKNGKNRMT